MAIDRSVILVEQDNNNNRAIYVDGRLQLETESDDLDEVLDSVGVDYTYVRVLEGDFDSYPQYFDHIALKKWVAFFVEKENLRDVDSLLDYVRERMGDTFYYTATDDFYVFAIKPERVPLAVDVLPIQECDMRSISEKDYTWQIEPNSD